MADALPRAGLWTSFTRTLAMIRFSHSVFALPFALLSLVVARAGWPPLPLLLWVLLAMVAARSAAMGVNRLADRQFDAANARTAGRHLVTGALSTRFAWGFTLVCVALFLLAAANINPLALALAPAVLVVLLGYSFLKRFTSLAHLGVGLALGLAPLGAWVAGRGDLAGPLAFPLLLGAAVVFWVAGFDVIYACQDVEADRRLGLHSIPARLGVPAALRCAVLFHLLCLALFAVAGHVAHLGRAYRVALVCALLLLARAHRLARTQGIGPANAALMPLNGLVAVLLGGAGILDALGVFEG
jgi:4-hydroxybenzoate polyprenyltransferase